MGKIPKLLGAAARGPVLFQAASLGREKHPARLTQLHKESLSLPPRHTRQLLLSSSCDHRILSLCSPLAVRAKSLRDAINRKGAVAHLGPSPSLEVASHGQKFRSCCTHECLIDDMHDMTCHPIDCKMSGERLDTMPVILICSVSVMRGATYFGIIRMLHVSELCWRREGCERIAIVCHQQRFACISQGCFCGQYLSTKSGTLSLPRTFSQGCPKACICWTRCC